MSTDIQKDGDELLKLYRPLIDHLQQHAPEMLLVLDEFVDVLEKASLITSPEDAYQAGRQAAQGGLEKGEAYSQYLQSCGKRPEVLELSRRYGELYNRLAEVPGAKPLLDPWVHQYRAYLEHFPDQKAYFCLGYQGEPLEHQPTLRGLLK